MAQGGSALVVRNKAAANLEFDSGVGGWRTVLDGVMGGLSTGRILAGEPGTLKFTGELSLDNNGGFSQIQTSVPVGTFTDQAGVAVRLRGDGRRYTFDVRCANVRMMAGSYQVEFDTEPDTWQVLELPFAQFRLHSFGRPVRNAPELRPETVESVGLTLADKKAGPFAIELDYVRPLGSAPTSSDDIATVAGKAGLTTLLGLVEAAGLQLPAGQRYTIFAPTNAAFARLPAEKVKFLTSPAGRSTLRAVLEHHVLAQQLDSASLFGRRTVPALSAQTLAVDADALTIGGAAFVAADVPFAGGLVHVIDAVLMPELRSLAELLAARPDLSMLRQAVEAAGLSGQLGAENRGPYTVLAPTDDAFTALPPGALAALLADRDGLRAVLGAHVIPSGIRRQEMLAQGSAPTLLGQSRVPFALVAGAVTAGGAKILAADIPASNGVVHVIDRVLLPERAPQAQAAAGPTAVSSAAILALLDLAIDRGVPLFNEGERAACAAIYELAIRSVVTLAESALSAASARSLKAALDEGTRQQDDAARAWLFRRAIDKLYRTLGGTDG